jgi:hypothetical protein
LYAAYNLIIDERNVHVPNVRALSGVTGEEDGGAGVETLLAM